MAKYTYAAQCKMEDGAWWPMGGMSQDTRAVCLAYVYGLRDGWPPHRAMRVVRSDGKVVEEWSAQTEVSVGMVAGWPTAEQYEHAAKRAMEKARKIREMNELHREDERLRRRVNGGLV